MPLDLGGNAETIVLNTGDPRTRDERLGAGALYLNRVVLLLREIIQREALLNKMWAWVDANEGHERWAEREKKAETAMSGLWNLLADLSDAAERLYEELDGWPSDEREYWIKLFQIPQPMTWRLGTYDISLDTTPWKDYCPF